MERIRTSTSPSRSVIVCRSRRTAAADGAARAGVVATGSPPAASSAPVAAGASEALMPAGTQLVGPLAAGPAGADSLQRPAEAAAVVVVPSDAPVLRPRPW